MREKLLEGFCIAVLGFCLGLTWLAEVIAGGRP
jgi:hypothetical protein